ncbi:G patch domain and ankyrin repeat-containing protein 1 [Rhizophlyctis rosea]|nr:G patch domain and ankyrin repeat-containing protein 1 [Rhizophlyctis rosea]
MEASTPWESYTSVTGNQPIRFVTANPAHPAPQPAEQPQEDLPDSVSIYRAVTSLPGTSLAASSDRIVRRSRPQRVQNRKRVVERTSFSTTIDKNGREVICIDEDDDAVRQEVISLEDSDEDVVSASGRSKEATSPQNVEVIVIDGDESDVGSQIDTLHPPESSPRVLKTLEFTSNSNQRMSSSYARDGQVADNMTTADPAYCSICNIHLPNSAAYAAHIAGVAHLVAVGERQESEGIAPPRPVYYALNETNVGYRLLRNEGWDPSFGLGASGEGRTQPISTRVKNDRLGIGVKPRGKRSVTHMDVPKKLISKELKAKDHARIAKKETAQRSEMLAYLNRD